MKFSLMSPFAVQLFCHRPASENFECPSEIEFELKVVEVLRCSNGFQVVNWSHCFVKGDQIIHDRVFVLFLNLRSISQNNSCIMLALKQKNRYKDIKYLHYVPIINGRILEKIQKSSIHIIVFLLSVGLHFSKSFFWKRCARINNQTYHCMKILDMNPMTRGNTSLKMRIWIKLSGITCHQ